MDEFRLSPGACTSKSSLKPHAGEIGKGNHSLFVKHLTKFHIFKECLSLSFCSPAVWASVTKF